MVRSPVPQGGELGLPGHWRPGFDTQSYSSAPASLSNLAAGCSVSCAMLSVPPIRPLSRLVPVLSIVPAIKESFA